MQTVSPNIGIDPRRPPAALRDAYADSSWAEAPTVLPVSMNQRPTDSLKYLQPTVFKKYFSVYAVTVVPIFPLGPSTQPAPPLP